ncbi:hypothetical protein LguiA_003607 [Lonicera macranthoides]
MPVGKDKGKVWEKLISARVVYLEEAEQVLIRDDKEQLSTLKSRRLRADNLRFLGNVMLNSAYEATKCASSMKKAPVIVPLMESGRERSMDRSCVPSTIVNPPAISLSQLQREERGSLN